MEDFGSMILGNEPRFLHFNASFDDLDFKISDYNVLIEHYDNPNDDLGFKMPDKPF